MKPSLVVAVTPSHGALKFNSVEEAIASPFVSLADPIFSSERRIDRTLIRGPRLRGLKPEDDAWAFLLNHAQEAPQPEIKSPAKRRAKG